MVRPGEVADRPVERAPFGWAALAAVIAVCAGPTAAAQTAPPSAPATQQPASAAPQNPVLLEADQLIDDEAAHTITAEGDVQVRYEGRTMRADRVVYDLNAGTVHATGDVEMVMEDGSITYADEVETDDSMNVAVATELRAHLGHNGTLAARAALRHGEGESELRNIIFTSCPICEGGNRPPTWSLRARRAIQNHNSRTITYEGAVLDVAGVPVLYLPFFGHPDPTVGRASGFLTPDVGRNSRLGAFYDQPYYWAISPSQDLTASLRLHENVNPLLGLDYRMRFFSGQMNLNTTFTQEQLFDTQGNRLGDDRFRWSAFGDGRFHINNYWDWGFGLERAYDDFYLRRYDLEQATGQDRGPYIGTRTRLVSQLYAIGQDADSYSQISFVNFQGLTATDNSALLPLVLPFAETDHVYSDPWLNGQLRLKANTAVLLRNNNTTLGNDGRFTASADWRKDMIVGPGLVVSPFAQARGDLYDIETTPDHYETVTRGLGLAGAQISWPFMRAGNKFDMIVEPIVMAAYGSQTSQDPRIVNEDSVGFELDESDLFRPNGAPNYDLWEPGGRLAVGVRATARTHSGESASLIFGRRFRSEADANFTPDENLDGKASDYVAGVETDLGHVFGASASIRLDDENLNVQRLDLGVRAAAGRFTVNARYFNRNDSIYTSTTDPNEEITAQVGVDLVRGWRAQFGLTRDLDSDINLRQEIAAIYEDDCTFLEITYSRSDTQAGTIGPDEGIQIRVGLRSLGVFGGS
ncbi:MAG: LPS assembly protein LptD [Terricaulis sp.]